MTCGTMLKLALVLTVVGVVVSFLVPILGLSGLFLLLSG